MKIKKYIKKMAEYLNVDKQKYSSKKAGLKHVLKKLTQRKRVLKEKIKSENNAKRRKALEEELAVVQKQRKKGLGALKELKKQK